MQWCKFLRKWFPKCFKPIPPPVQKYENRDTCMDSWEMRNTFCPPERIKYNQPYRDGDEPTTHCHFHVEPEPPIPPSPYPTIIPDIHAGFLGFFLWFLRIGWDDLDGATSQARETFDEMKKSLRPVDCDWFMWLSDAHPEHAHLNLKTPYMPIGSKFDLSSWQPRYWELFTKFIELHAEFGVNPAPNIFMDRYCYEPFSENINNVNGFWSEPARVFQRATTIKALGIIKDVFGQDYKPRLKPINESAHHGSQEMFHLIGDWHRDQWNNAISDYTDIHCLTVDNSMCEGAQIYLNEPLLCGKPYEPGEIHGHPTHDRADVNNSILAETHSISTIDSFEEETLNFLISRWQRYKFHGDGSDMGSIQLADTDFREGNADETYEMGKYLWTQAKEHGKQAVYSLFPMESFRDAAGEWNLWIENYNVNNIMWDRCRALCRAWEEVYG